MLDTSLVDPFLSTAVPLDRNKAFLLRFFCDALIQQLHWIPSFSTYHNQYIVTSAVRNPLLLYSILCRTSVEFAAGGGKLPDRVIECATNIDDGAAKAVVTDFADFRLQLERQLSEEFEQVPQDNAMTAMALLVRAETINGTSESVSRKIQYLQSVKSTAADLSRYPPEVMLPVTTSLYLGCAVTQQIPPFAPPDVASLSPELFNACPAELLMFCSAFEDLSMVDVLGDSILRCMRSLRQALLFKHMCSRGYATASLSQYALITHLQQSAEYYLMALPSKETLSERQEVSRLTILIATMTTNIAFEAEFLYARALADQLRKALSAGIDKMRREGSKPVRPSHFIWCCFIGAFISRNAKERSWFVLRLARVCSDAKVAGIARMRQWVSQYIYFETLHGEALQDVWREMEMIAETFGIALAST